MQKPNKKTKIVELEGVKYRLSKLDARSASYLAVKSAAIIAPAFAGEGDVGVEDVVKTLPHIPRKDFEEMQTMLLSVCAKLNDIEGQLLPEPILMADGSFVDDDMAYDVKTVISLTVNSLIFNVGSFFQEGGLLLEERK